MIGRQVRYKSRIVCDHSIYNVHTKVIGMPCKIRERPFYFMGRAGRFSGKNSHGHSFSTKKIIQDRVNSIVRFVYYAKRQDHSADENNIQARKHLPVLIHKNQMVASQR